MACCSRMSRRMEVLGLVQVQEAREAGVCDLPVDQVGQIVAVAENLADPLPDLRVFVEHALYVQQRVLVSGIDAADDRREAFPVLLGEFEVAPLATMKSVAVYQ